MINFIHRVKGSETDYFPPYYQKKEGVEYHLLQDLWVFSWN